MISFRPVAGYWAAMTSPAEMDAHQVDARGLRCPLPALRLARAVRETGVGAYRLLADDPAAQRDIPALCAEHGWQLVEALPTAFQVLVP